MDGAVISKREGEVMALFLSLSLNMLALGHAGLQKNKPLGPKREVEQSRMPDGLRKGKKWILWQSKPGIRQHLTGQKRRCRKWIFHYLHQMYRRKLRRHFRRQRKKQVTGLVGRWDIHLQEM